ncbi:restriction endonuclease subunit S [Clostridium estertheticum]|uniref:restriction endonuclease subunit S n=1 Tax=Clostridium estertheticum TaxID=238834 RepID=UPI001C0D1D0C|nr:restriction endonuclease subunit S [Clostridium estertheticum]MBU3178425.1 restriction endonuclease subunit S [Clostridium estertheticum]
MIKYKLARYDDYKYSEFSWLDKIPNHWHMERVKTLTKTQSGTTPRSEVSEYYENGTYFWVRTTDLNNDRLYSSEYKITDIALKHCGLKTIPINSILLAMYGGMGTIGKNSILKETVTINQSVCAVLPNDKLFNSLYFWYYVQYFRSHWEMFADSARKDPNINQEAIKKLWVIYPPIYEQKSIANYLDTKTAQIDRKIDLLTQKSTKYGKLKQSLINETVTRGLDKTVAMKDSGVEWIGKVPEHWGILPIRALLENRVDKNVGNLESDYLSLVAGIGVIPYAEKGNVGNKKPDDLEKCKMVYPGDFVLNSMNFGIGSFGISRYKGVCSSVYIVMRPRNIKSGEFLYRIFQIKPFQTFMSSFGKGIMEIRMAIKWNNLKNIHIPYPPMDEQKAIADYLDTKTTHIDRIIKTINIQISKLKELRKSLINDVVTGKIKVYQEGEAI